MVQIRVSPDHVLPDVEMTFKKFGSGGIRTHAPEETGALNQRLRPLGHATLKLIKKVKNSPSGTRTRVAWVKTMYPDQLD